MTILGITLSLETLIVGALTGLAYAVMATGLVLVYRATRVINFAHGQMGALGAAALAILVLNLNWNFFLVMAMMLVGGGLVGAAIELGVVRRLFKAPRLILLIATIGLSQLLLAFQALLPGVTQQTRYPSPLNRTIQVGDLILRSEHFMVIAFIPAVIVGLAIFMTRTPYGIAIRAAAENPDAATLVGISPKKVSTVVWIIAGVLSTLTAILIGPLRPTLLGIPTAALGPGLLLRALTAGLVGQLVSIPRTLVGGVAIGVVEAVLFINVRNPGIVDALLFVTVLVLLLVRAGGAQREEEGAWSLTPKVKPAPERLRGLWWVRRMPQLVGAFGLLVALLLPLLFRGAGQTFLFSRVFIFAMIALSVTVLTGWAGQLSLGQFAFVGLGALMTAALNARGVPFGPAVAYATVAGVLAALLVGFPALRVRGLFLAVATLGFAVAARDWFFTRNFFMGDRTFVTVPRGSFLGLDLRSQRPFYYLCLLLLVAVVLGISRLRRSGVGRVTIAVRDNEQAAASFGVSPALSKLTAFGVAGGLAALAGALFAGLQVQFGPDFFGPEESLNAVAMTIIGGLGSIGGSILGAIYIVGVPALFGASGRAALGVDQVALLTSGIGLLILLLYLPGGLVQIAYRARDQIFGWAERRFGPRAEIARPAVKVVERGAAPTPHPEALDGASLRASDVTVRFGGLVALNDVTVEVGQGEVVGLIGPNGAGKSTLMNVISGFITAQSGTVEIFGINASTLPPFLRSRLGPGRVFQDARLFPDLTVREAVGVALESEERSELVPSMLALPPSRRAEARKASEAADYISFMGLGRYADSFISDLSTGTRRIVEMASLLAQKVRLLLLDEPTAGIAQRETEAFAPLIKRIQKELGASVLIIEHDMPLVMSISDRIYCLAAGEEIAQGTPESIRSNPKVVAAYLGTDERAIMRSGALTEAVTIKKVIDTTVLGSESEGNGFADDDLRDRTRHELLEMAAALGIQRRSRMRKEELIRAVRALK